MNCVEECAKPPSDVLVDPESLVGMSDQPLTADVYGNLQMSSATATLQAIPLEIKSVTIRWLLDAENRGSPICFS